MEVEPFDTIIVGAGTAGCLLANRLSRDPSRRVLLVEAGRKDNYPWIHIPVGYLYCIGNPRTDWLYQTEPEAGLNGRALRYPRGKALGGCSSINGMIYMRGQARDYDRLGALTGDDDWCWANSLADFKAHEDHFRLDGGAEPTTTGAGFPTCTVTVANGASTSNACTGTCSRPLPRPPPRPAYRPPTTSIPATTTAWGFSRSTRRTAGAGMRPRPSCGRSITGPT